jgi:hypothetical protein
MAAQVFKAIGGGLLSARLVVIVEFLPCLLAHGAPGSWDSGLKRRMLQRHAGVSLPGRVARDSTFHRKAACQAPASNILIWSKVADARTETSGDPLESRLSVFSPVVYLSMPFNCWPPAAPAASWSTQLVLDSKYL